LSCAKNARSRRDRAFFARFTPAANVTAEHYNETVTRLEKLPVLKDVGIELVGKPEMLEIHNLIKR
jgi:hypothetical protein